MIFTNDQSLAWVHVGDLHESAFGAVYTYSRSSRCNRKYRHRLDRRSHAWISSTRTAAKGSDADALSAWPEQCLLGSRLAPNQNGRNW